MEKLDNELDKLIDKLEQSTNFRNDLENAQKMLQPLMIEFLQ